MRRPYCRQPRASISLITTSTTDASLRRDAVGSQAAVADLVRVYQFRDRDRICCHDVSVTQCDAFSRARKPQTEAWCGPTCCS
jgi:hypothetical protein